MKKRANTLLEVFSEVQIKGELERQKRLMLYKNPRLLLLQIFRDLLRKDVIYSQAARYLRCSGAEQQPQAQFNHHYAFILPPAFSQSHNPEISSRIPHSIPAGLFLLPSEPCSLSPFALLQLLLFWSDVRPFAFQRNLYKVVICHLLLLHIINRVLKYEQGTHP